MALRYSTLPYPKGCFLSGSLPASFAPTMVIRELPASEILLTASSVMAMECVSRPIAALNPARNTLAMIPMILVRTITRSPFCICETGTSSSCPSAVCIQTCSTPSDIVLARSSTDFLCVHSSRISPIFSRNMTLPAVLKSPRSIETVIAAASSTSTSSLPCSRHCSPLRRYFSALRNETSRRNGSGRMNLCSTRRMIADSSFSSYSRFSTRPVCAGTSASAASS